jgi:hypothetical protein
MCNPAKGTKNFPITAFILLLFFSAVAGTQAVNSVRANPYSQAVYKGEISAPSQPTTTIMSPHNNTNYNIENLSIILNVSITKTNSQNYQEWISRVYYKSDWLQDDTFVYEYYNPDPSYIRPKITEFFYRLNFTEIPEGQHHITFYAVETGYYYASLFAYYGFSANSSSVFIFTVDTTPPVVSVSSVENKTYKVCDVPLSFSVNELVSQTSYSLDGQNNVTVAGNTTLTGLSVGEHDVTVYAWDAAGNVGSSETVTFTVAEEPESSTTLVAGISGASVAVVCIGLLLYFRKRNR